MPLALRQHTLTEGASPLFEAGRKLGVVEMALVWPVLHEDPQCPSRVLRDKVAQSPAPLQISVRHLNRLRVKWQLNRCKGRPRRAESGPPRPSGPEVVRGTPRLSYVGVHLFAHWLEQQRAFGPVVTQLHQAIQTYKDAHPAEDFALLHPYPQTLLRRFQALFFAPLLGIKTLTGFDTHEHPLPTLVGKGYHSSTLLQFLGQRERIEAAAALRPALVSHPPGPITYVDGHMIAYWSRVRMHKGKSTMLGRIMAGSQAVIAHNEAGQALFVSYHPPDQPLSQIIVAYCQQVVEATGGTLFVIDRAVNAVAMACAFAKQGWGLLCMLDDNEHDGLDSFDATEVGTMEDGTRMYSGPWKVPRHDDPRYFVLVEPPAGKTLVYWGTPQVRAALAVTEWPRVYRERSEIQENSFKRMLAHGALKTNDGRKKIVGPDRPQQRAREQLDHALTGLQQRADKKGDRIQAQQAKVAESAAKGHGKRLEPRQRTLAVMEKEFKAVQGKQGQRATQEAALGPPGERADRDFRKQTIMTVRTLLLENALTSFMAVLLGLLNRKVSLECLLTILFERSGSRVETASQVIYWVNTAGLSVPYHRLLAQTVEGLCAMDLRDQGKPMQSRLKATPL